MVHKVNIPFPIHINLEPSMWKIYQGIGYEDKLFVLIRHQNHAGSEIMKNTDFIVK